MARRTNSSMGAARAAKKDEFYTQLEDIEAEMRHYWDADWRTREDARNSFADKTILLNCDDPLTSNFWFYFAANFDHLGIKELISTHYEADGSQSYAMFLDRDEGGNRIDYGTGEDNTPLGRVENLQGNGDFRDRECVEFLKRADIVVTNPPFSLFTEYLAQLVEYDKQFIIIGNMNAVTFKGTFPLIREGKIWLGATRQGSGQMWFVVADDFPVKSGQKTVDGVRYQTIGNSAWFTNVDYPKRHEPLVLVHKYEGSEHKYPRYDNFDAIEVSLVKSIPKDYAGVMGVPITFLGKRAPEQFEIVGYARGQHCPEELKIDAGLGHSQPFVEGKAKYDRILIRNLHPGKEW